MPEIMAENEDAWRLWEYAATQWRVGLGGRSGIDYGSVLRIADAIPVDVCEELLFKIRALEQETLQNDKKSSQTRNHGQDKHQKGKEGRLPPR